MLLNTSARIWLFTTFLCIFSISGFSQRKNFFVDRTEPSWIVKLNPKRIKLNPKDVGDGYYLGLVDKQNHAELKSEYRHYIREIVSQTGVQNASEISVTYDPSFQKLTFHKIIVWRDNQPIDKLVASKFKVLQNEKELSKFIYSGTFDAYLILDDVRKGDRIEYAYSLQGRNPILEDKYTNMFYFEGSKSYAREYTNLIVSKKRKLNFKNFNFNKKPVSREIGDLRIYEWENTSTKTHPAEEYEPSWYVQEKYTQVSEYQSWEEVVNWGLRTNSYPSLKTPALDKTAKHLQYLAKNDQQKYIELAIRFVQDEIRYMGIEMGEYSQRPNSPEAVLMQRYGDCKDKSLLLIYLLQKQNINAYMAYVDTYSGKRLQDFLPSPFLFDHAVVVVERDGVKTWIDPTMSQQRGTFQSIYFPDYGKALVLKSAEDALEDVVSMATGKLSANLNFIVPDTAAGSKTTLIISSIYTDNYADDIRSTIEDQGTAGLQQTFLEYIGKYYPDIKSNADIVIQDDELKNEIQITESYLIDNIWLRSDQANTKPYIYFYGDLIESELRGVKNKNRKSPLSLKYPINVDQSLVVQLPGMWGFEDQSTKVESDEYYFEYSRFSKANTLKINFSYRNFKDHIAPENISRYAKDIKIINNSLSTSIQYNTGTSNVNNIAYPIVLGCLSVLVSAFFFLKQYHYRGAFDLKEIIEAPALGGWLVLVGIVVVFAPLSNLFSLVNANMFPKILVGEKSPIPPTLIKAVQLIKVVCFSIQFSWSILIIGLFFRKRDNLPQQFMQQRFFGIILIIVFAITDLLLNYFMNQPLGEWRIYAGYLLQISGSLALISYFRRSERVRKTFVFTYPELPWKLASIKYAKENGGL